MNNQSAHLPIYVNSGVNSNARPERADATRGMRPALVPGPERPSFTSKSGQERRTEHSHDPQQPDSFFSTERLQLACFLHAANKLKFLRAEPNGTGKVSFIFADPEQIGDQLELEYEQGAVVAANALFASQKYLRRRVDQALDTRRVDDHARRYTR